MNRFALFGSAAALALAAPSVAAQEQGPPQMLYIVQDFVKPAMLQQYEANTKAFLKDLAATPKATETIRFTAVSGMEVGYIYVVPVSGWADLGKAFENWEAASKAMGQEKWGEHMARGAGAVDHSATSMIVLRPDLSYKIEGTALTPERPYRHYSWWYVIPGKEQAIEAVAKEYVALYRSKGIETGWRIYQSVVGPDNPMYLVVAAASDPAAYQAEQKRIATLLGQAGRDLSNKAMQFARRVEQNDSWIRPDLSFPPMQQQMGVR